MTASATSASRTVVVAFAEALTAPEVASSLVDAGFAVFGVARSSTPTALSHGRLVTLHEVPPPETDAALAQRALTDLLDEVRRGGGLARRVRPHRAALVQALVAHPR